MARSDLAARVHDAPRRVHATVVVALIVAVGLVSWWSIEFRPPNAVVAYWWPAAALGAAAVIMARRRMLVTVGIFIAVFLANFAVGRPVSLDLGYALANAGTALAVGWIATAGGRYATIRSVRSAGRFILAVAVGALVVTIVGAATAWMFAGADPVATVFALYPSHASALLVLTPITLVDWRWRAVGRPFEAVLLSVVFVGVLFAAYWPGNPVPLGFTTIAVLLWAAFRMPIGQVAIQLGMLGIVATTVTAYGWGSYAELVPGEPRLDVMIVQLSLIVHACASILVAAARADWGAAAAELAARETVLRSGLLNIDTGLVIAEIVRGDTLRVLEVTPAAERALGDSVPQRGDRRRLRGTGPVLGPPALDEAIRESESGRIDLNLGDRGQFEADVTVHTGPTGTEILTIVLIDVTARDAREREALETAEQLRDLNRQKDAFIASVSHELRTPVTAILGFVEELADSALPDAERQAAAIIDRNARRLAAVIDDVLELSRLTTVAPQRRPAEPVNVSELVCMACDDAAGLAPAKALTIVKDFTDAPRVITTTALDLERVISNLLSNAVKFSPVGGTITVSVAEYANGLELRIGDQGPGIPPSEIERVWERFYRVADTAHRDVPGTGLGLPIVKALIERRLGGEVRLESDGQSGTTAVVRLPRVAPDEHPLTGAIPVQSQETGA
ncbi:signal transduction histidine kinase [Microcella putealis]|uniref:histidine kinase n=1 Tax=Microcella putealis TaxID=337005 RepID=A0A4V2EWJ3_9MICO|nr:ATP-binding protein [Microcella putealis]RZS56190.1 signal transduction histidine kinase [Microcella putealis]TQM23379.1 signal transduction histidine kinase [Microcella putealis]